jgi:uroporphyrin-3 C-methyltransferase
MTSKNNEIIEPENNQDSQPENSSTESQPAASSESSDVVESAEAEAGAQEVKAEESSESEVTEPEADERSESEDTEFTETGFVETELPEAKLSEEEQPEAAPEEEKPEAEQPQPAPEAEAISPQPAMAYQPAQPAPELVAAEKQGKKGVKLATLAIVLALFVGGGSAYLSNQQALIYKYEMEALKTQISHLTVKLDEQARDSEGELASMAKSLTTQKHLMETQNKQQEESITSLQHALADFKGRRPNDWLLAEADYLVKLAGRKLFLDQDVESATQLMESADQRISALNDPSLVPLRKQMTKDIVTLKAVPLIDREGLSIRLTMLQQQVDKLPLSNAILPDAPVAKKAVVSDDIQDWQENLKASAKEFSEQFITFRSREGNVIPLLSPEQHYYLKENIKGKIENAIRAIYSENGKVYKTSLNVAAEWAEQFFNLDDPTVAQFTKAMKDLGQQNIEVTYPVQLDTQKALADVINERLRRDVTSMTLQEGK